jgi:hypothetical protein
VGGGDARPPAAVPAIAQPGRSGKAKPVSSTRRGSAKSRSRRGAGDNGRTGESGVHDDGSPTRRRAGDGTSGDGGERDDGNVSRGAGTDGGDTERATDAARDRGETAPSGGGRDDGGDPEERSSGAAEDDGKPVMEAKQKPASKALAVATPEADSDRRSDDDGGPGIAPAAPIIDD